jgi:hypothetical protein
MTPPPPKRALSPETLQVATLAAAFLGGVVLLVVGVVAHDAELRGLGIGALATSSAHGFTTARTR